MSKQELSELYKNLMAKYQNYQDQHLNLNMARGKPSTAQLDLSMEMLDLLNSKSNMKASSGEDCRNYGVADGLPEMRNLFADLLGMDDHWRKLQPEYDVRCDFLLYDTWISRLQTVEPTGTFKVFMSVTRI
jgi:hypothetical protein